MQRVQFKGFDPIEQRKLGVVWIIRSTALNNNFHTPFGVIDASSLQLMLDKNILIETKFDWHYEYSENGEKELETLRKMIYNTLLKGNKIYEDHKYAWNVKSTIKTAVLKRCSFIPDEGHSPRYWIEFMNKLNPTKIELEEAQSYIDWEDKEK